MLALQILQCWLHLFHFSPLCLFTSILKKHLDQSMYSHSALMAAIYVLCHSTTIGLSA